MDVPQQIKPIALVGVLMLFVLPILWGEDWQPQPIGPFSGLNDRDNSYAIPSQNAQALLNVDLTPGGKSIRKRKGYGQAYALTITTSPVHGTYAFFDSNGNDIDLFFNDTRMTSSVNGMTVLFSTGSKGATYSCTDSLGFAYCANSARTNLIKTNGATYSTVTGFTSTGTMVTTCPTRLTMGGFSDSPSRIDFSADSDFTSWGSGSLGTSPAQFIVNSPGARITHIVYAFGRLMWFKDSSFGYILIGNQPTQSDWVIKTVAYDVGTNDNSSIYREGNLYFRGQDGHIYSFDGSNYQRLSREIQGTINSSLTRTSNAWSQSTQSDFNDGVSTAFISTDAVPGSVVVATTSARASFTQNSQSEYQTGTLTNMDATSTPGHLYLSLGSESIYNSRNFGTTDACSNLCTGNYYQSILYTSTDNFILSSFVMSLKKTGNPGDSILYFKSDNSGTPGSTLDSASILAASVGTSLSDVTGTFTGRVDISSGTSYWLVLIPQTVCDSSNKIEWYGKSFGGTGSPGGNGCGGTRANTNPNYAYQLKGKLFNSSGNYVSTSFDVGFDTNTWLWNWSTFSATYSRPSGSTVIYETQSSPDGSTWDPLIAVISGFSPTSTVRRYIRYKITFTTSNQTLTPDFSGMSLAMSTRVRPTGTYDSAVKNAPDLTAWDTFQVTKQDNGGSHSFFVRASNSSFLKTAGSPSWTAITAGAIPSISTGSFFQIRDVITPVAPDSPKLDDFQVNWFEGSATDKMYCTYFIDRLWFSVTNGTSTANNRTLLYDLLNRTWLVYDIGANGFYIRQNKLYFGSSTSGYVFKFGDTDDNGSAINSYWKSKDFFGSNPFSTQELSNISIVSKSVATSSMTVTYTLDGQTSNSYTVDQYNPNGSFTDNNRNLPAGTVGSSYNVEVGNDDVDQPWEIFGIQVGIRPRPWKPTP